MRAGTVVLNQYKTLDDKYRAGLFLIIYDEKYDSSISLNGNLLGLKITSTNRDNHYDVPLLKEHNPFIDHDSYIMCSKPHVIEKANLKVLGNICFCDLLNVYLSYKRFNWQVDNQMIYSFGKENKNEK